MSTVSLLQRMLQTKVLQLINEEDVFWTQEKHNDGHSLHCYRVRIRTRERVKERQTRVLVIQLSAPPTSSSLQLSTLSIGSTTIGDNKFKSTPPMINAGTRTHNQICRIIITLSVSSPGAPPSSSGHEKELSFQREGSLSVLACYLRRLVRWW